MTTPPAFSPDAAAGALDQAGSAEPPAVPVSLGAALSPELRHRLHRVLWQDNSQLGSVYRARVLHPQARVTDLLQYADTANVGATWNRLAVIIALMNFELPGAPSTAGLVASSIRALRKRTANDDLKRHYESILAGLGSIVEDEAAQEQESAKLEEESAELESTIETSSGVYVYTYPHYLRYPFGSISTRRMFKVGQTSGEAWVRVRTQARLTGLPEEPVLLRVYTGMADPAAAERKFHLLLDVAEHERSQGRGVGKEWFSTTLDYLDTIANVLNLQVMTASLDTF